MEYNSSNIKRTAIPLSGYLYQNLVGIRLLCEWLDDPSLYDWVQFEADHDDVPLGLDDVVALRRDGQFVLLQVKFTVNAMDGANALDWRWLLAHKLNGRSLLQKWAKALFLIGVERVQTVALVTNRLPDREFDASLDTTSQTQILAKVDEATKNEVITQLGGLAPANEFFAKFEFQHSFQGAESLERTLTDRLIPRHTDRGGWLALHREAIEWAVRKNCPAPHGRISIDHLRGTLSARRPRPLEQSFHVPEGYQPPDMEFASDFLRALDSVGTRVLWGEPGQGKSTFLSYVCRELEQRDTPFVRHHYFLKLGDQADRFTLASVADSLMSQMEAMHFTYLTGLPDGPEHLRDWLCACAEGYAKAGKRFVIVVDGLDHVWRENDRDKGPLDSLFSQLFPVPPNARLIIGTQRVADQQLPKSFAYFACEEAWVELPRMSLTAMEGWLRVQYEIKRFDIAESGPQSPPAITALAKAFQRVTGGHPLVLTYRFEEHIKQTRILDPSTVESAPWSPLGDVKKYYEGLWRKLSFAAKDALHLLADSGFIWPSLGLETCLAIGAGDLTREIGHMLHNSEAGQIAFHGSLYAFVKEDAEHAARTTSSLPRVVQWLRTEAPAFHRWGWLWLYEDRAGDSRNLLEKPNREWVIESLARAYPEDHVEAILEAAETLAFNSAMFARAVEIRWLKTRVQNGPEFQVDDYDKLFECAIELTDDEYTLKLLSANLQSAGVDQLCLLGKQYLISGRRQEAIECLALMRRRINDRVRVGAYAGDGLISAMRAYLLLAAGTQEYEVKKILQNARKAASIGGAELLAQFFQELSKADDLKPLMQFGCAAMPLRSRRELELACMRLAGALGARLHEWPEFVRFEKHPMSSCWRLLYQQPNGFQLPHVDQYNGHLDMERGSEFPEKRAQEYLHRLFFQRVAQCIVNRGAAPVEKLPVYKKRKWLTTAVQHIVELGNKVGGLLAKSVAIPFALPFRLLADVQSPRTYDETVEYRAFSKCLTDIAGDLYLLTALRRGVTTTIPSTEWAYAKSSPHFNVARWYERGASYGSGLLTAAAINEEIDSQIQENEKIVVSFNERTSIYLDLCERSLKHGLRDKATYLLRKTLSCMISYAWRKDPSMRYVVNALTAIANHDRTFAIDMLKRISPIVMRIDDMTEKDGVRPSALTHLVMELMPEAFGAYYNYWLENSAWYSAELAFADFLAKQSLEAPEMGLVTTAVWDSESMRVLRNRSAKGDTSAQAIIAANATRFGLTVDDIGKERYPKSPTPSAEHAVDVTTYPPDDINGLLDAIKSQSVYVDERRVIKAWFRHWREKGHGIDLLRRLERFLSDPTMPSGIANVFDLAFEASLQLEGAKAAYRWLVAAQIGQHGWDDFYDEASALQRFGVFARHYKTQWKQFIWDTTQSADDGRQSLGIPHDRLVHFLLAVDEIPVAKSVVAAMVSSTVDEFAEQPLDVPSWLEGTSS
jgi:NACHT domain